MPAQNWGAKCRQLEEFISPAVTDSIPTVCALLTKETVDSGLDDGRFGLMWWRDQVSDVNRTIASEYTTALYPTTPGSASNYQVTPLWYESGDGGIQRGVTEFQRRHMTPGSRRFLKVGNWFYFPNLYGTPCRWNGGVASATGVNRLMPSGPISPTHAGTLAKGSLIVGGELNTTTVRPDGDISAGTFTNQVGSAVNLYQSIDETTADDTDYIQSAANSVTACEVTIGNLGFVPANDAVVQIKYRARKASGVFAIGSFKVYLVQGATVKASSAAELLSTSVIEYTYTLTAAEIASITDWNDLRLRPSVETAAGGYYAQVTHLHLDYAPNASLGEGNWKGSDRFLYSVAYRFEDGSVWMPCTPRLPSADSPAGYNLFTVDASNPTAHYDFVTWSNIPIGPHGVIGRILLRSLKIDSTIEGEGLKLNPYDLRVVWELTDNSTTTYVDAQADDFGLAEDLSGSFIRWDHLMPPRSRYIAGGDMRIVHAYGGRNPCAITLAPVGRTADYDLNLSDTSSTAYTADASYVRVRYSHAGNYLDLSQGNGTAATDTLSLDLATYNTLQKLVDRINQTSCATNGQQWRAQLCPGANPAAPSATCLTPHTRDLTNGTVTATGSPLVTRSAGGLSVIAVGTYVTGTGIPADTYIISIDSDTQLTMSANATAANADTIEFETRTGDQYTATVFTYQRVVSNAQPAFLYFNASYLNQEPVNKSKLWMTVASPGSMKSAANSFSGKESNAFAPPTDAGIAMGGAAVDQGFVLPFSRGVYVLKNTRDSTSGIDEDYKLVELNANRGCCAWNTVTPGNRFVPYLTPEGVCAADLDNEVLLSEDIFLHAPTPTGSMAYEVAQSVAATGQDNDSAYATAKVMRSVLFLNYRAFEATHPNLQVQYDFSSGYQSNGIQSLFRGPGQGLWGWSTPLERQLTAMCEARRADGSHLYGWQELNQGAAGDGRLDEFETGDDNNGTELAGELLFPWEKAGVGKISPQELVVEHVTPAGATAYLDLHRSYEDDVSTLTLTETANVVTREVKMLPQAARAATAACSIGFRQTEGPSFEVKPFTLRAKKVPAYK